MRASFSRRATWRPPVNSLERNSRRHALADLGADDAGAEGDHVGVVVLAGETRRDGSCSCTQRMPRTLLATICSPVPAAAQHDPELVVTAGDGPRRRGDEVRVVDGLAE